MKRSKVQSSKVRTAGGQAVLLAVSVLLLAGCGAAGVQAGSGSGASGASAPGSSSSMSMAPGESMPGMSSAPTTAAAGPAAGAPGAGASAAGAAATGTSAAGGPPEAARMVCGDETKANVVKILALSGPPHTVDSWKDKQYTCTYHLSDGPLVLSVKVSADDAAAHAYFGALKPSLGSTRPIEGLANLGLPAYQNAAGSVVFVKDNMTLHVDASRLPAAVGPHGVSRNDLSYEVATAILGCWSEG